MRIVLLLVIIVSMVFLSCRKVEEPGTTPPAVADTNQTGLKTAEMIDSAHFSLGQQAPDLSWGDITTNTLKAKKGSVVLIVVVDPELDSSQWTLTNMNTLWNRHNHAQLQLLLLFTGNNMSVVDELRKKSNIPFDQAWISQSVITALDGLPALPTALVVDKGGKVARMVIGERDLETWETMLSPYLSEQIAEAAPKQ